MDILIIFLAFTSVFSSYYIGDWLLQYYYSKYQSLQYHRKRYVVKNFIKGIYLSIFIFYASIIVKDAIWSNKWYNNAIHTLGILYCLPDLMGLLKVPKLHKNTVFHHITVCILSTINTFNDYESQDTIWKGIIIYAYLSSLTGIVNLYLAYRLVCDDSSQSIHRKYKLAIGSYYIYGSSLFINWSYQIYTIIRWLYMIYTTFMIHSYEYLSQSGTLQQLWLSNNIGFVEISKELCLSVFTISSHVVVPLTVLFVYLGLLYFVIVDDIVLIKFLKKEVEYHEIIIKNEDVVNCIQNGLINRRIPDHLQRKIIEYTFLTNGNNF